ncbi:MAG: hypothetical protein AAB225_30605 [Acidobacteriota bacterium]
MGRSTGQAFPGNAILHSRFDPLADKLVSLWPAARWRTRIPTAGLTLPPLRGLAPPNTNLESPDVGKVRGTDSSPRVMQFALRLEY